jgi:hypothetical protein
VRAAPAALHVTIAQHDHDQIMAIKWPFLFFAVLVLEETEEAAGR